MSNPYRARDTLDRRHPAAAQATVLEDAAGPLHRDGLEAAGRDEDLDGPILRRRISKKEIIYTTGQLSIMVETGITLSAALAGILEQEENPTLRRVLMELREAVEAGEDFSSALAKHPRHFGRTYVALVKASEATGSLGEMLDRVATYLRKEVETRSRVRAALAYPSVMFCMAIGVTVFLLTYVLPKFIPIFESRHAVLPGPTRVLIAVSGVFVGYWYLWLAGLVAAVVAAAYARRTESGRQMWDAVKVSLPLVGATYRKVVLSRSLRTLATMLSSGVSIIEAIKLTAEVANNYHYEQLWMRVLDQVTAGRRIHEALVGNPLFPSVLVQMITSGEEAGKLDYVLRRVSDYYDQEVETALKTTTSLIEPIMIAVMGVVVGGIGLALMLPVFSLSKPT